MSVILALCLFTACQKDHLNSQSSIFFISIDSSVGSLTSKASGDTFLVGLKEPSTVGAVPLVYHLPTGAAASSGKRQQQHFFQMDNVWADTLDLTPNKVHTLTVTSADGTTKQYVIAFRYKVERLDLPRMQSYDPIVNKIFFDGDIMYVATNVGMLVSVDDGKRFTQLDPTGGDIGAGPALSDVYARGKTIYAGFRNGLAMSQDGGQTFTPRRFADLYPDRVFPVTGIAVQGDTIYATTVSGLMISRDRGVSFDTTTNGLLYTNSNNVFYSSLWCIYASGSTVYVGGQAGFFTSNDGGRSFIRSGLTSPGGYTLRTNSIYVRDGDIYLATIDGFSVLRDRGQTVMNYQGSGLPGAQQISGNGNTISIAMGKLIVSSDLGQSYTTYYKELGLGNIVTSVTMKGDIIYCGTQGFITKITPR